MSDFLDPGLLSESKRAGAIHYYPSNFIISFNIRNFKWSLEECYEMHILSVLKRAFKTKFFHDFCTVASVDIAEMF